MGSSVHSCCHLPIWGKREDARGEKKDCNYLTVIDGRVLDKLGEDKIKRVAGGIN